MEIKQAIITGFMGKLKDRFSEYHEAKSPEEKIAAVARVKRKKRGIHRKKLRTFLR